MSLNGDKNHHLFFMLYHLLYIYCFIMCPISDIFSENKLIYNK